MVYFQIYYYDLHETRKFDETSFINKSKIMKKELRLIKRVQSKLLSLLFLSFLSCSLIWVSQIFGFPFSLSFIRKYNVILRTFSVTERIQQLGIIYEL